MKKTSVVPCLATLLSVSSPAIVQAAAVPESPNFLVIVIDDMGYMDIGANNPNTFYETPNIDKLANTGMRFTNGYAANPVCSPTRFSIQTGRYPTRRDATDWFGATRQARFLPAEMNHFMPLDEITMAEALKRKNYKTFFAGKWHLGETEDLWPEHQGYDINKGGTSQGAPHRGGGRYFAPYNNPRLADGPKGEYLPNRLAEETVRFLEEQGDKPFLAVLSFYNVHTPLMTTEALKMKYEKKKKMQHLQNVTEFKQVEQYWPNKRKRMNRIVQNHTTYAGMVEATDTAVGRVLDKLEELGLDENTVVFFTADNGGLSTAEGSPTSNLPLRGGKGWIFEGGIREPFIIRAPGVTKAGAVNQTPICSIDIFPTVMDFAGVQPAKDDLPIDGVSLKTTLAGETMPERDIYWHYPHYSNQGGPPAAAIRSGDWKLVEFLETGNVELYNIKQDIGESKDLSTQYTHQVRIMRSKLHDWYKQTGAKFLRAKNGKTPWQPSL